MNGVLFAMERFTKPTVEEVEEYQRSINAGIDAENFVDFYTAKGWLIGKSPMKDWRAAVRTWKKRTNPVVRRKIKLFPIAGKNCKCGMPAVYHSSGSQYDNYYCALHMPNKIKEIYE